MNRTSRQQFWIEEVRAFRASGMSRAAFCRARGYSVASLKNWERFASGMTPHLSPRRRFAAVSVPAEAKPSSSVDARVRVRLPLGVEIEAGSMPSSQWLAEVLLRLRDGVAS